jgi:hypothetical protein
MASRELISRLEAAQKDLITVVSGPSFQPIRNNSVLLTPFNRAQQLAEEWLLKAEGLLLKIDDLTLQPLVLFVEGLVGIADNHRGLRPGEAIPQALTRLISEFLEARPALYFGLLDAVGALEVSKEDFTMQRAAALHAVTIAGKDAREEVLNAAKSASAELIDAAKVAINDLELAKKQAARISVTSAEKQFLEAAENFRNKAACWALLSAGFFVALIIFLCHLLSHPPVLVQAVTDALKSNSDKPLLKVSVPLLVAASAYFTSIRLTLIAVFGIGFAFSLRMTRAYLHMLEHNRHKLRVTNSIEAFVAAVRTPEHKDLVLGKLVESVTEFGDSGILGKQGEAPSLPSVIFESMTKNVSKSD